jgi:hypothetical protein
MMKQNTLLSICKLLIGALVLMTGSVNATPYAFSIDQIMLTGNVPGYAEDEFNDGIIAPPWLINNPTVRESGGVVTFSNPGVITINQYNNYLIIDEESEIVTDSNLGIEDGLGDFDVTSKWVPIFPTQNQLYGMSVHIAKPLHEDSFFINIEVIDIGPLMADIFGVSAGLNVMFGQDVDGKEIDEDNLQFISIKAEDVTDNILLSMNFNDSADLFSGEFSLDGGATFMSPFSPISTQMSDAVFESFGLYGDSLDIQTIPESSTILLLITGLFGLGFVGRKRSKEHRQYIPHFSL